MILTNKLIWITGASSGIGEALAKRLASSNQLILSARNETKLNELKATLKGSNHVVFPMDVSANDVAKATQTMVQQCGFPDVVFFNAGISQRSLTKEAYPESYRKLMDVNYFGVINPFLELLQNKPDNKKWQVVVTNSVAGKFGYWLRSGYAASKHALTGFFDVVALEEFQNNLKVTQVFPGRIDTPINNNALMADGQPSNGRYGGFKDAMHVEKVVSKILIAVEREKPHKIIAGLEWVPLLVYRLSKKLFFRVFSKQKPE